MSHITIDKQDIARINGKLENVIPTVQAAIMGVALTIKGKVARAPRRKFDGIVLGPNGATTTVANKMKFKSQRQHKYVMAAIREGLIEVPWKRAMSAGSEALSKSWTVSELNGGFGAVIGNDTSYGPWVQDRDRQSLFHAETGWVTVQAISDEMQPLIGKKIRRAVNRVLTKEGFWEKIEREGGVTIDLGG